MVTFALKKETLHIKLIGIDLQKDRSLSVDAEPLKMKDDFISLGLALHVVIDFVVT